MMNIATSSQAYRFLDLPHNWRPRSYQRPLWKYLEDGGRRAYAVWHRRAGKDDVALHWAATAAVQRVGVYWHMLPEQEQARKAIWRAVDPHQAQRRIDLAFPREMRAVTRDVEMNIELLNGSLWQVVGSDNFDSLVGSPPVGVVFSEWPLADPRAWAHLSPILEENGGWAIFNGTPRGPNHAKALFDFASGEPGWFCQKLTAYQTPVFGHDQLERIKREYVGTFGADAGGALYEQEYECFKPDALVACADRVRPISEIVEGDVVLTHTGRLRRVERTMSRHYAGDMVVIDAWGSRPIVCTPDHPIRVCNPSEQTYSWKSASAITADDWLVTPRIDTAVVPFVNEAAAKIIAWYVCEGNISGNNLTFSIGAHEPEFADDLCDALAQNGYESSRTFANNVCTVSVNNVGLADFLVSQCGSLARFKRIPLGLLRGRERVVWDTLIKGDGCIHKPPISKNARPVYCFSSVSEGLIQQVQILGAALGHTGTYSIRDEQLSMQADGRAIAGGRSYSLQMRAWNQADAKPGSKTRSAKNGALGRVKSVSRESYVGTVFNLSVAGDESYVVHGRAVHNCSFEAAVLGAFYGRAMADAEREGRITGVPYDPSALVWTAWDLGISDSTAIWFCQIVGKEVHLIDYLEGSNVGLEWYVTQIRSKKYAYGGHLLPHDADARELGTGKTRIETLQNLGLEPTLVPIHRVEDGINAVRTLLPRSWFDKKKCARGIEALKLYRSEYDEKNQTLRAHPVRDWTTHPADAMRYAAMGLELHAQVGKPPPRPWRPDRRPGAWLAG